MSDLLSYEGFKHLMESQMVWAFARHGEVAHISSEKILKDNDRWKDAILVEFDGQDIKSCNYPEDMYAAYKCGESIEDILESTVAQTLSVLKQHVDMNSVCETLANWENVRPLVGCRLINAEANRERLKEQSHTRIGEFAVSYYLRSGMSDQRGGFYAMPIRESMRKDWGVSLEELHAVALQNMDLSNNFILESALKNFRIEGPVPQWFTLTSKERVHGATVIVSKEVLEIVKKRLGGGFYIIPITVHELIVIKKKEKEVAKRLQFQLKKMNLEYSYADQEYLSNHVYEYNSIKKKLLRAM